MKKKATKKQNKNKTNKKKKQQQQQQQQTNVSSYSRAFLEKTSALKIQVKVFWKCPKRTHFPVKQQTMSLELN